MYYTFNYHDENHSNLLFAPLPMFILSIRVAIADLISLLVMRGTLMCLKLLIPSNNILGTNSPIAYSLMGLPCNLSSLSATLFDSERVRLSTAASSI